LVVIAAVAWMVHSTPDSNRSIQRFRKARRSLAPQGRRHRAASSSTTETSTVVVMERPRRSRANRVIDLRERDPEPRPARWPADGWSLGSVAPSGPRIAWATSGASTSMRTKTTKAQLESAEAPSREAVHPTRPDAARSPRPGAARMAPRPTSQLSQLSQLPQWNSSRTQARSASPRPQGGTVRQPAAGHLPADRPASRPAQRPVPDAKSPARWRVIDLTPEPRQRSMPAPAPARIAGGRHERPVRQQTEARRWALAAGAESQGAPGPLPAVFRLDPLHARNEAGSRAR
jgi:hypothetical protein